MTVTALFRDFLIQHKAKQKYENAFNYNYDVPSLSVERIVWDHDGLFKLVLKRMSSAGNVTYTTAVAHGLIGINTCFEVIRWDRTDDGYDYWDGLASKWTAHYRKNIHLINR